MPIHILENETFRVGVLPEIGGSLTGAEIHHAGGWAPLLRVPSAEALAAGNPEELSSFICAPFFGRLADDRFTFQGKTFSPPPTSYGVLHGYVRFQPWETVSASAQAITLHYDSRRFPGADFPLDYTLDVTYELHQNAWISRLALTNAGDQAMPAGFAFHPYFNRYPNRPGEPVALQMNVSGAYTGLIPEAAASPIAPEYDFSRERILPPGEEFDLACAGWDGKASLRWPSSGIRVRLEADPVFSHLVLYTPPEGGSFAVEPVSHAPNGFNLLAAGVPGSGIQILQPGESLAGAFSVFVEEVSQ